MIIEATSSKLRKTGITAIGDVPWGTHFCYFYETKQDLLETMVLYFKEGLESKEFCVWVVSQALSAKEAKDALRQAVPDLERHLAEGALEIHSHQEWYLRGGRWDPQRVLQSWREKLDQGLAESYTGLRAAGDGGWVQNEGWMGFREYEEEVNAMIADQRSIILCTYPLTTSSGDQVFDVAHIHHLAVARRNGTWETVETSALKEAKAEIKRLNEELELKVEERTRELAATNEALRAEIAERKLAEAALRQAEDRIRLVIDTIPTIAWTLRSDGAVDFVNQRWLDYTSLSLEESLADWQRIVHPEDLPRALAKWLPNMAAGNPHEDEMRFRRADGEYRWFLVRIAPLRDEQGTIVKWYGVSIDIEDRRQAEIESRTLIDAIPHQIWSGPADGTVDYCNARWRSYVGIGLQDLQGDGWQAMLHPEDRERVLEAWQRSVANGTPYEQEERHRGADGIYRWFLALGLPTRDTEGRIVRWYGTNTDIEDRKQAEGALWHTLNLVRAITEGTTDAIYAKDRGGRYLMINTAGARFLGKSPEEVIGLDDTQLFSAETAARITERDRSILDSGETRTDEETSATPSGVFRVYLTTKGPLRDSSGAITGLFGVSRDITERREAEQALHESEARFRRLLASNIIGVVFWTLQGQILDANDLFLSMVGYTRDDLHRGRISWKELTPPEYAIVDDKAIAELLATGTCLPFEKEYIRKDGSRLSVLIGSALLADQNQTGSSFVMDITQRKQAEERLRRSEEKFKTLFGMAPVGISVLDRQLNVIDSNPALEQITRLSKEQLASGAWRGRSYLNADGTPKLLGELPSQRAMAENGRINDVETGIVTESGEIIWTQVSVAPLDLPDASGVVITQDITERKRAAKELEEANRQLRVLSRRLFHIQEEERRHLARELHDEIGQTLTAAKINLKIIAPDVSAKVTGRLDDSIQLLDQLLRQVRQLSLDLRPPLLDELGLVPTLRWLVDQQAQRAGLRVTFTANVNGLELDPDVQTACFRVAQEAITNIIRHSGAKIVAVELWREEERLWLSVRDDGAGFHPAVIQQGTAQHSTLGLVSMKERALLVRGGFEVRSAPGQGTEIRAWFPLALGKPRSKETA